MEMGNAESTPATVHPRMPSSIRHKNRESPVSLTKLPRPEPHEIERRFNQVLASMDLPPDKVKLLRQYEDEKKWDMICDQERVHAKETPPYYLRKLKTYLDPKASRSSKMRRMVGSATSTQVLRDLEISLRTNHIEWVREFLNEENRGLDVLVDYLSFRLLMMKYELKVGDEDGSDRTKDRRSLGANRQERPSTIVCDQGKSLDTLSKTDLSSPRMKRASKHVAKLKMGESKDDIHVCIMCLRAIMNNKYGFNLVIKHDEAITCIALSLNHKSLRTKALVLELLAAICLVKGGHEIILGSFDRFKDICDEKHRFETLMNYFMNYELFHIEFMVACTQFINIVVHSVEDMNFRVHLQYEFSKLGLDDYLEKLRNTESEELQVQISAYLDNVFDVQALMEDSETKTAALEKVADLEDELGHAHERIGALEFDVLNRQTEMERQLSAIKSERDDLADMKAQLESEVASLRYVVNQRDEESRNRQVVLESRIHELETITQTLPRTAGSTLNTPIAQTAACPPPPPPPPPPPNSGFSAPAAPPPPPPPPMGAGPMPSSLSSRSPAKSGTSLGPAPPPPAPGMGMPIGDTVTIKRKIQTKYKLPTLNWIVLKPNQVKGTIFSELDDEKLHSVIDFNEFEEQFKIGTSISVSTSGDDVEGLLSQGSKRFKRPELLSLLEHNRLRNIAICRRKLEMRVEDVIRAVNALDLKSFSLENVDILLRMLPTDTETKAYRDYTASKKSLDLLTEEDRFIYRLSYTERLSTKLNVMHYIGNFFDNIHLLTPQIQAISSASRSLASSKKLRAVLEVVLAFGNYLNSGKRGPAYGFKLQSLDSLADTKSGDRKQCLMHYIVETIHRKMPDVLNFDSEIRFIEKAATVSLENVLGDIQELQKGMELTRREFEMRKDAKDDKQNTVLKDFLGNAEEKLGRLRSDSKSAQDAFNECLEYFGERQTDANAFFGLFARFIKTFKQVEQENEQRRRLQQAAKSQGDTNATKAQNGTNNPRRQHEAVITELRSRSNQVQEKKLLPADEVYHGALEDILLGLKSEPYRRADAVRRSQRRRNNTNRLSKNLEDIDVNF